MEAMERLRNDPFFEELKADIQAGIDEADRGELIPADQVLEEVRKQLEEFERRRAEES